MVLSQQQLQFDEDAELSEFVSWLMLAAGAAQSGTRDELLAIATIVYQASSGDTVFH